jgi:hypothetical protein
MHYKEEIPLLLKRLMKYVADEDAFAQSKQSPEATPRRRRADPLAWIHYRVHGLEWNIKGGRAVLRVHPRVSIRAVTEMYRMIQQVLLPKHATPPAKGQRTRRLSEKTLIRYEWITKRRRRHPKETWRVTREAWNQAFPHWAHLRDLSNFIKDCRLGERYLALPSAVAPERRKKVMRKTKRPYRNTSTNEAGLGN